MQHDEESLRRGGWTTTTSAGGASVGELSTSASNNEHDAILAQLNDMFGEIVSTENILAVCNLFNWQLDDCIEALIRPIPESDSDSQQNNEPSNQTKRQNIIVAKHTVDLNPEATPFHEFQRLNMARENRNLGAIPKYSSQTDHFGTAKPWFQQQQPNIPYQNLKAVIPPTAIKQKPPPSRIKQLEPLVRKLRRGLRIMILMRGAPGTGKSYLARQLVDETVQGSEYQNHICSTDDYFYDSNGNFVYRPDELSVAHDMNQRQARSQAEEGWSPLIIDNTNIKQWEMFSYVKIAVDNAYLLEIVEPMTHWSKSAGKCAIKNRHGVPKDKIQRMMDSFERTTVAQLMLICNCEYRIPMPQLRSKPPVIGHTHASRNEMSISNVSNNDSDASNTNDDDEVFIAAENKEIESNKSKPHENDTDKVSPSENAANWKSYEQESVEFWKDKPQKEQIDVGKEQPKPPRIKDRKNDDTISSSSAKVVQSVAKDIDDLIRFDADQPKPGESVSRPDKLVNIKTVGASEKPERHDIGCENESELFATLRQIYPNKQVDGLWDLFEKCQGDIDWAVDILLKDDSCVDQQSDILLPELFQCTCNPKISPTIDATINNDLDLFDEDVRESASPKRQRTKREKMGRIPEDLQEIKKTIENQFVLADHNYSERLKKVRETRYKGVTVNAQPEANSIVANQSVEGEGSQTISDSKENDDMSSEADEDENVEIVLGDTLVEQLAGIFELDIIPKNMIKDLKTNVFIPKSLAYQLYLVWVESVYNQVEEQKQLNLKDDVELAKVLSTTGNNSNLKDVKTLNAELVSQFYSERNSWDANSEDLASHLTKLKLAEEFPNVGQQTLLETLQSTENRYAETVQILQDTFNQNDSRLNKEGLTCSENTLLGNALEKVTPSDVFSNEKTLNPDEAKKLALHNFEVNRNMAVHHSQLKAECYQKAKEAIQKGNTAVAVYYSQIAGLHKQKVDAFNHTAANCIVAVHDVTQNNPEFIDLHYLHVAEAEQCLDIFIDKHIRKLKSINKSYKYVFIITGRGLHSAGGVSIIKNRVKSRLKDRNLKWNELNPGLLKVKVFCTSRFGNKLNA